VPPPPRFQVGIARSSARIDRSSQASSMSSDVSVRSDKSAFIRSYSADGEIVLSVANWHAATLERSMLRLSRCKRKKAFIIP
jgi:hypothetical protein